MSQYAEWLKHPLWQRKRLEILQRDEFCCTRCNADEKTLHVHHGYYARGLKPWESEEETLYTLCEECHEREQALLDRIQRRLGALGDHLETVLGFLDSLSAEHPSQAFVCESPDYMFGLGARYCLTESEVFAKAKRDSAYRITDGQPLSAMYRRWAAPTWPSSGRCTSQRRTPKTSAEPRPTRLGPL